MWKKGFLSRGKDTAAQVQIGNPVLIETSYDTRLLQKAHTRQDSGSSAGASHGNGGVSNTQRQKQALQIRPYSNAASSFYSQPTPNVPHEHWPPQGLGLTGLTYDVSPVDDDPADDDFWSNGSTPLTAQTERTDDPFDGWSNAGRPPTTHTERTTDPFDAWSNAGRPPTVDVDLPSSADAAAEDPKSRFSWTTRATSFQHTPSLYYAHSPPPSPPPVPAQYSLDAQYGTARQSHNPIFTPPAVSVASHLLSLRNRAASASQSSIATSTLSTVPSRKPVPAPSAGQTLQPGKQRANTAPYQPQPQPLSQSQPHQRLHHQPQRSFTDRAPAAASIMDRGRGATTPTGPARPPLPTRSMTEHLPARTSSKPGTPSTPTSANKALPLPPSLDNPATDHVTKLSLQLDALSTQRNNITRLIQSLTDTETANNPLVTDLATRRAQEARVKSLEAELAEVGRQEHDVGMKLHRARKREEREGAGVGFGTLWVRRVTE
ncbi:uncharacterized protein K452DRAFT_29715 [Aplosporella prunicola CBS 121167]|uniref:Uncharacterized protein n=1 Tax=Aplosporella prunicola CBS 121167 TaxID=1176127 RepID=A0A6A6AUF0_9PEZI|nr:uncharacterized protein K452DRAFT_29715 [Aplosporella prunicola CBS 121167]KAF2135330.1 hypothetical protein K452DRAFT_29715 [Aplosporella prunicola CBS 121167]